LNRSTTALSPSDPGLRPRAPLVLWRSSATVLSFLPVAMAVAHRSSPLVLAVAAVLAVLALGLEQGWTALQRELAASLASPLGRAVLAFLVWSVLSLAWSEFPGLSLQALLEFWLPVACALVLSLVLPTRVPRWGVWFLTGTLAIACVMIILELRTGLELRRAVGMRSHTFIFNRSVLTALVVLVPVLAGLRLHGPGGWLGGVGLAALAGAAIAQSESGAAVLGAAVAAGTAAAAFAAPRLMVRLAAVAVVLTFTLAPVLGPIGDRLIPPAVHTHLANSHSRDRIDIWNSFGAAIREGPWIGFGFGVSPRMGESVVAAAVAPERRELLAVGHPHNAAVQIWTELGLVGAALAALILLLVLKAMSRFPRRDLAPMLALLAGAAAVALVGHGAWQGWWSAAIGTAVVWFRFVHHLARSRAP
jgi:O-antigen ligase